MTRYMKLKGQHCFHSGLPLTNKINRKKLREIKNRERIRLFYRDAPLHSHFIARIHCFGELLSYIYCFTLYANLFYYMYTHPIHTR
jgi:hypothetical protein